MKEFWRFKYASSQTHPLLPLSCGERDGTYCIYQRFEKINSGFPFSNQVLSEDDSEKILQSQICRNYEKMKLKRLLFKKEKVRDEF